MRMTFSFAVVVGVAGYLFFANAKACSGARVHDRDWLVNEYEAEIQSLVLRNWTGPFGLGGEKCEVDFVQLPGGDLLSAKANFNCQFGSAARQSAVDALMRTQLPYKGFESIFQRSFTLVFSSGQSVPLDAGRISNAEEVRGICFADRPATIDMNYRDAHPVRYPLEAVKNHHEGRVVLEVYVGSDDLVAGVHIRQSSGFTELDAAALDAARSWRYTATRRDGVAVPSQVNVPVTFFF